jgi:hypothetical protein
MPPTPLGRWNHALVGAASLAVGVGAITPAPVIAARAQGLRLPPLSQDGKAPPAAAAPIGLPASKVLSVEVPPVNRPTCLFGAIGRWLGGKTCGPVVLRLEPPIAG